MLRAFFCIQKRYNQRKRKPANAQDFRGHLVAKSARPVDLSGNVTNIVNRDQFGYI